MDASDDLTRIQLSESFGSTENKATMSHAGRLCPRHLCLLAHVDILNEMSSGYPLGLGN